MTPTLAKVTPLAMTLIVLGLAPASASGQGEGVDVLEIARQIRRNMITVEEGLLELDGSTAGEAARQAAKDIERLIDGKGEGGSGLKDELRKRGNQVVEDIGKIIKSMKPTGKGSGQGQGKQQQGNQRPPQSRDRNQSQQKGQRQEQQGQNRQNSQPRNGQRENNTGDDPKEGDNLQSGKRPEPEREKVQHADLLQKWGNLPPERRQRLVDRNFQDFTPEYEVEIRAYFKKILKR